MLTGYETVANQAEGQALIFGDLHGQRENFTAMLMQLIRAHKKGGGYLWPFNLVFLGDFVDRGPDSLNLLYLIYTLKMLYWDRVFVIRGNHESKAINKTYGFKAECMEKLGIEDGEDIYNKHNQVFEKLAAVIKIDDKIIAMHGGIPSVPLNFNALLKEQQFGFEIYHRKRHMTIFSAVDYRNAGNAGAALMYIPNGKGGFRLIVFQFDPVKPLSSMPDDRTVAGSCMAVGAAMFGSAIFLSFANGENSTGLIQQESNEYAQKAVIVSRVVNGFSTSESMNPGPFDEKQLIKELFPYGDNAEDLDATGDVNAVVNMMGSECIGDNGCAVHKQMLDQIEKVAQSNDDPKLFKMITPGLDVLNGTGINDIQAALTKIKKDDFASIVPNAITAALNNDGKGIQIKIVSDVGMAVERLKHSEEYITDLQAYSSLLKVKDQFEAYAKMLQLISSLIPIQQFKMDLDAAQAKYQKLMSVATPEFIKNLESKLAKLADMDPESNQKKVVTAGFYNGFDDLKNVLKDNENDWLKEALNPGKDLDKLKLKLKPLEGLVQKLEPLNKVWKEVNFDSAQKSIYDMQLFVSNLDAFSGVFTTLSSVQTCFENVKTGQKFEMDLNDWIKVFESASSQLSPVKSSIDAFTTEETAKQLVELYKVADAHRADMDMLKKKLKEMQGLEPMIENLKKLHAQLESAVIGKLNDPFNVIKDIDSKVIKPFISWSGKLDFSKLSTCLKSQNFKDELEKMNPKLEALDSKKPSQQQMDPVKKLNDDLKKLGMEVAKITVSTPKRARHRRANKEFFIKNHKMAAQQVGEVHAVVQKLIKVKAMKSDVQELINGKAQIDAVIQNESDPNVKGKLNKLWNDNTVEALKGILNVAEDLDEAIKKREIKIINDLALTFTVAANVTVSKVDIKKLAIILDGKVQDPKISASLNNLKSLDLKFSKHNGANIGNVIHGVQLYFDSMFDVKRCVSKKKFKGFS
ncbi:hypothetical protein CAEBREN_11152 [Caenorhabditis brenneri]|uniref:Serine/threonine-protein phosphatase n=1 Tax=Caenorhabditis brenneri TaxID=135651 RepID=G0PCY6_CAEBE|nr:hypothetical protein CAEBREN_11152 [Caenorhabditis brenneri]